MLYHRFVNTKEKKIFLWQSVKPSEVSLHSFLDKLFLEPSSQEWLEKRFNKYHATNAGSDWIVKDSIDVMAASKAIAVNKPSQLVISCDEEGKFELKASAVSSIFANTHKPITVSFRCMDSFFGEGEKRPNCNELFNICCDKKMWAYFNYSMYVDNWNICELLSNVNHLSMWSITTEDLLHSATFSRWFTT